MNIEEQYKKEFNVLIQYGDLVGQWARVYDHCKTEGIVAGILSQLLNLSKEDSEILIKAAILHDWYKKNEIERANKYGYKEYERSENDSYDKLIELGYSKRIAEVAHSVGAFSLKKIINSPDLLKRLMHFIDDICLSDKIVEVDERMDHNESQAKYSEVNESGRKEYDGKTYFEVQRKVGKQIQSEIEAILKINSNSLVRLINDLYENMAEK